MLNDFNTRGDKLLETLRINSVGNCIEWRKGRKCQKAIGDFHNEEGYFQSLLYGTTCQRNI